MIGCEFVLRPGKAGPTGSPMWDFIIYRDDGKAVSLHPEYNGKRPAKQIELVTPSGSTGKMRFAEYRKSLGSEQLKFDPSRRPSPEGPLVVVRKVLH